MYLNALESQRISGTDTLSLIYLPNQARSRVQYAIFILLQLCFKNVSSVYQCSQHYSLRLFVYVDNSDNTFSFRHCYYMTRRICGIKQVIVMVAFFF